MDYFTVPIYTAQTTKFQVGYGLKRILTAMYILYNSVAIE